MKVLVTGGAGCIGSVLTGLLLERGHKVVCLDRFFFGKDTLNGVMDNPNLETIRDDVRWFDPKILRGVDTVMDLAALSNDPAGELDPAKTLDINYVGRARVAKLSKEFGVKHYLLASSCSVYGFKEDEILDETSPPNPLTTYAKANLLAEREALQLADNSFVVTVLRQATVYGLSPRMRFDLAINGMVLGAFKNGKIPVMRDGSQWRPFIHVKDTSNAFLKVAEAKKEKVNGQIFNVGSDDQNYQVKSLVDMIAEAIPVEFGVEWYGDPDRRSYRVSFQKFKDALGFKPQCTPKEGAKEVYDALAEGRIRDSAKTRTVEWYKHLLNTQEMMNEILLRGTLL
jgi:nucleoside-diphosphate-sugar epimerase